MVSIIFNYNTIFETNEELVVHLHAADVSHRHTHPHIQTEGRCHTHIFITNKQIIFVSLIVIKQLDALILKSYV